MCISFELSLCGFWKSLVSELHTHTVIQRPSNVVSSIPHPFLYTPQWLLGIIGVKILKLHQAHLWVEMDSKVHRLQKHHTPRNRVEKMRNIPLINPHTPGVVDSPDVPSCYSLPFLACFNNRCFTRHPCPLACRWVPPVQDIGWRLERKKNRIRAFLPRLLLPAPARRLSTTALPGWLPFCIWRSAGVTVSSSNVTRLEVLDHPMRIPPPAPPLVFDALNPPHVCLPPKGTLTDSGFSN